MTIPFDTSISSKLKQLDMTNKIKIYIDPVDETESKKQHTVAAKEPSRPKFALWEECKENIKPLPQGRNIEHLFNSLKISNNNEALRDKIKQRQKQFEADCLAQDCSTNPDRKLNLWVEFIEWLEQNIPDGGKVSDLSDSIEKCIEEYHDKPTFKQDPRLFRVMMKFKKLCDEPAEVFGFMYSNSICHLFAEFYIHWSELYESRNNFVKAERLLQMGIDHLATPRELLLLSQKQLKCRMNHLIASGFHIRTTELATIPEDSTMAHLTDQVRSVSFRSALQALKYSTTKKSKSRVPIKRIGGSIDRFNVGGLKSQTKVVNGVQTAAKNKPKPTANAPVKVFNENLPQNEMFKIPTSQSVSMIGKTGSENKKTHLSLRLQR